MKFKVSDSKTAERDAGLILGILSMPPHRGKEWETEELVVELGRIGLTYTARELDAVISRLVSSRDTVTVA